MMWGRLRDWLSGKSVVAGIVEVGGGIRVIVSKKWRLKYHVAPGEHLVIVPGLRVDEPVCYDNIPAIVNAAQTQVRKMT